MRDNISILSIDDIKYRIKDYTGEEFDFIPKGVVRCVREKYRWISEIAEEIGEYHYNEEPDDLDNFKCCVDLLYKDKIYSFEITGERSIDWGYELKEITDYTEIKGE